MWHSKRELPEAGTRVEVMWPQIGAPRKGDGTNWSTKGRILHHRMNNSKAVVYCPDDYTNQNEGWFIGGAYSAIEQWRYIYEIDAPQVNMWPKQVIHTDKEGAKKLFVATTVKAKGGYRAQVTFNSVVVWEGDEVYKDDEHYQQGDYEDGVKDTGVGGQQKAQKAAQKAVDQAVEALFAKVKV